MPDLESFQTRLGHAFRDVALLRQALTHPSSGDGGTESPEHNQRLEFLGDAVLRLILVDELYNRFPARAEGALTSVLHELESEPSLAEQARSLELSEHLALSRGEIATGGAQRQSILADAFEAILGAIYLDGGFEAARAFVRREFDERLEGFNSNSEPNNPKRELQELFQARSTEPVEYRLLNASGSSQDPVFECAVWHGGAELGRGQGRRKKLAEAEAARAALVKARG